ncbi:MAG: 4-alpha-glucanotransferase, partial [Calditrichaeota bacterium]
SPEQLFQEGWLTKKELDDYPALPQERVDYELVSSHKSALFAPASARFLAKPPLEYSQFCSENKSWLDDYALFIALKEKYQGALWNQWPNEIRDRSPESLRLLSQSLKSQIDRLKFQQFVVQKQWSELKAYCSARNIRIIGDLPIYVDLGSVDVWSFPHLFKLDENKEPYVVAGVPPDYFSATGQRWGNPLYNWEELRAEHFSWWIERLRRNLTLFDIVRIDHFRGLVAFWQVPAEEETAINGQWVEAPIDEFVPAMQKACPQFNVIAEDLGLITDDVKEKLNRYQLPGMKVLQFAFGDSLENNVYLPHRYPENAVVYTGTHDNNTTKGWYRINATDTDRWNLGVYLQKEINEMNITWSLIELALASRAHVAIFPAQDILQLDERARMNTPGTEEGNWEWRLLPNQLQESELLRLSQLTTQNKRA